MSITLGNVPPRFLSTSVKKSLIQPYVFSENGFKGAALSNPNCHNGGISRPIHFSWKLDGNFSLL